MDPWERRRGENTDIEGRGAHSRMTNGGQSASSEIMEARVMSIECTVLFSAVPMATLSFSPLSSSSPPLPPPALRYAPQAAVLRRDGVRDRTVIPAAPPCGLSIAW